MYRSVERIFLLPILLGSWQLHVKWRGLIKFREVFISTDIIGGYYIFMVTTKYDRAVVDTFSGWRHASSFIYPSGILTKQQKCIFETFVFSVSLIALISVSESLSSNKMKKMKNKHADHSMQLIHVSLSSGGDAGLKHRY